MIHLDCYDGFGFPRAGAPKLVDEKSASEQSIRTYVMYIQYIAPLEKKIWVGQRPGPQAIRRKGSRAFIYLSANKQTTKPRVFFCFLFFWRNNSLSQQDDISIYTYIH